MKKLALLAVPLLFASVACSSSADDQLAEEWWDSADATTRGWVCATVDSHNGNWFSTIGVLSDGDGKLEFLDENMEPVATFSESRDGQMEAAEFLAAAAGEDCNRG